MKKSAVRRNVLKELKNIPFEEIRKKSEKISTQLTRFLRPLLTTEPHHEDFVLGVYAPLNWEVQWEINLDHWEAHFAFPNLKERESRSMEFYKATFDQLQTTKNFGVELRTPPITNKRVCPDILLVPSVAITRSGKRLGYGKGFYDRYLATFKGIKIGPVFNQQILTTLPSNDFDQKIDVIITEDEIIDIN